MSTSDNEEKKGSAESPTSSAEPPTWTLRPLTAEYKEPAHGTYVWAIREALKNKDIQNIALSGNYGVGKSSIVRGLSEDVELKPRILTLSLSTLAPIETSKLDESIPKQAATTTNRIQQEIVKQLLYRESPGRLPGSRFARIERFGWWRELGVAGLAGFVIALVFLITGWTGEIELALRPLIELGLWAHLVVLGAGFACALAFRWLSYGRIYIKQFSAGSATVALDDKSVSYFDQYLDEIVHFFEISKKLDIVIFEDIDRFNDPEIFETLRTLNTLLNSAPQIKNKIRFVYAIKDSIFDKIGLEKDPSRELEQTIIEADDPAMAENVRANRTKFFDLVIPVVPFITHRNARNLASKLLGGVDHDVEPELFDLAAQYLPDMRLLINVRNEFLVFRDRIFSGDGEELKLSQTQLFAMMLYKSTHLTDFEEIRRGESNLDVLYRASRDLVVENVDRLQGERRALRSRLARIESSAARSEKLGRLLLAHTDRLEESLGRNPSRSGFSFEGVSYSAAELKGADFWQKFSSVDEDAAVLQWSPGYGTFNFSRRSLTAVLGDPISSEVWDKEARKELQLEISERSDAIDFLRGADMGELIERDEFLVTRDELARSLGLVAESLLKDGLAYQLVRSGYINRDFTLYTSIFHGGRVSAASTNFIMHHVEPNMPDAQFKLAPEDVNIVVRERGRLSLKDPTLYNVSILDHLLKTDVSAADIMIKSLVSFGEDQRRFLQTYLDDGQSKENLIKRFAPHSARVIEYLVADAELPDDLRMTLVDAALASLADGTKYRSGQAVKDFLLDEYENLHSLTAEELSVGSAENVASLFESAGVIVPNLAAISNSLREGFISRKLYEVTLGNLTEANGSEPNLALDSLTNEDIYRHCLENLTEYLAAIGGKYQTVESRERFIEIVEDALEVIGTEKVEAIVAGASSTCVVGSLSDIDENVWPALAQYDRFPPSFENVTKYIESIGSIDTSLGQLLTGLQRLVEVEDATEEAKVSLATKILNAGDYISDPEIRARLVESLEVEEFLKVDTIPDEDGSLFANLLKRKVIADEAESFERISDTDWPTREAYILASADFHVYMEPKHVQSDLGALLLNDKINVRVKNAIVARADDFVEGAGTGGLSQLARYAIQTTALVSEEVIVIMASRGVPAQHVIQLLSSHLNSISSAKLFAILESLGGSYSDLTAVGFERPKLQNTEANRGLLVRLQNDGIVNTFVPDGATIRVNKRRKSIT